MKKLCYLSKVLIYCKEIEDTAVLYTMALGLNIVLQNSKYLELTDTKQNIVFYKVDDFAHQSKGYSPILQFKVQNYEETSQDLLRYGAKQEGQSCITESLKVGLFQAINGEIISIFQGDEIEEDTFIKQQDDAMMSEIKQILGRLQI